MEICSDYNDLAYEIITESKRLNTVLQLISQNLPKIDPATDSDLKTAKFISELK